jgi:DNA helicase-2/ATP-dependent DNA helicase PcrA
MMEISLVSRRIPYVLIAGFRFWDRREIRALVDYVRVVCFDNDRLAISRTINVPKRGIGEQTINKLLRVPKEQPMLEWLRSLSTDPSLLRAYDIKGTAVASKIRDYISCIDQARVILRAKNNREGLLEAIDFVLKKTRLLSSFDKTDDDRTSSRADNIGLVCEYIEGMPPPQDENTKIEVHFLNSVTLNPKDAPAEQDRNRVTISTMHSAKGLEWPVVYVINCVDKSNFHSADSNDELRLMYVAATRAKVLLYFSYFSVGKLSPLLVKTCLPEFVVISDQDHFPALEGGDFHRIAAFLGRPAPNFDVSARFSQYDGFSSARAIHENFSHSANVKVEGKVHSKKRRRLKQEDTNHDLNSHPDPRVKVEHSHNQKLPVGVLDSYPVSSVKVELGHNGKFPVGVLDSRPVSSVKVKQEDHNEKRHGDQTPDPTIAVKHEELSSSSTPSSSPASETTHAPCGQSGKKRLGVRRGPLNQKLPFT